MQTLYYIVFLSIICLDSICVFLIIAFVYKQSFKVGLRHFMMSWKNLFDYLKNKRSFNVNLKTLFFVLQVLSLRHIYKTNKQKCSRHILKDKLWLFLIKYSNWIETQSSKKHKKNSGILPFSVNQIFQCYLCLLRIHSSLKENFTLIIHFFILPYLA